MASATPQVLRTYQNHHLDSTRWALYRPRGDDIIVSTSIKAGTTWMLAIVENILHQARNVAPADPVVWVDFRIPSRTRTMVALEGRRDRRVIKSHLPLDGLPYFPHVKYIVVARDPRDLFMSLHNHYLNYTPGALRNLNTGQVGEAFPECPDNARVFWRQWITKGWFPWETEGYPFWGNLHHTKTWWEYRHLPNILFVHYSDLLSDTAGEIRRVAEYLAVPLGEGALARMLEAVSFDTMRARAVAVDERRRAELNLGPTEEFSDGTFKGGLATFFHKGENGRWRGVLTEEDLSHYAAAIRRVLRPDCAVYLERGLRGPS